MLDNRKLYTKLKKHISSKEYTILTGARQVGKTTLLKQIFNELEADNKTCVFLNLDRKSILNDLNKNPENVFKYCPLIPNEKVYIFIDEIQYLDDPANFLKLIYDEYALRCKLVVTGSSAFYIDEDFSDSLAGRKKLFEMRTLDFDEFLILKGETQIIKELAKMKSKKILHSVHEVRMLVLLEEYLTYGGYPAVVALPNVVDKIEKLEDIRDSYVKRDILESGVKDEEKFYKLMVLLADQSGNLVNVSELANTLRMNVDTVNNYIHILQKCFHITLISPYYSNVRKELTKMPKVYFNDLGLRNAMVNYFAPLNQRVDKGVVFENHVFSILSRAYDIKMLKFWRTADGNAVDFIVNNNEKLAIEVKFSETDAKPKKYEKFTSAYPDFDFQFWFWGRIELFN